MIIKLLSIVAFVLGCIPLWIMFRHWQNRGNVASGFVFTYFLVQHISFGLGALIIVLFNDNYKYINLDGTFTYADDIGRLMGVNLAALYSGLLAAVLVNIVCLRSMGFSLLQPSRQIKNRFLENVIRHRRQLKNIAFIFLGFHLLFLIAQTVAIKFDIIGSGLYYFIQTINKVTPSSFFFVGLIYRIEKSIRKPFVFYAFIYFLIVYLSGGRGTFLYAMLAFLIGFLSTSRGFIPSRKQVIALLVSLILIPVLSIQSENIRQVTESRNIFNTKDLGVRVSALFGFSVAPKEDSWGFEYTPSISNSIFRFGARILEVTAYDVIRRTPEEIPHSGVSTADITIFLKKLAPAAIRGEADNYEEDGVMVLKHYGWVVDPGGGTSFPVTLLADSWRRYGWSGVIVLHFLWAFFLAFTPFLLGANRNKLLGFTIAGTFFFIVLQGHTSDWFGYIATLPRLLALSISVGFFLYLLVKRKKVAR